MTQTQGGVRRVTIHVPDHDLHTTRVRGIGYRQACRDCDARVYGKTVRELRQSMREHRATLHP